MSYDGSIKIDTAIDGSGFNSGLSKLSGVAKTALAGVLAGIITVSTALSAGAMAGVKYNAQMEQYMTSFTTMLGSADKATSMVSDLKKFAAETPFEFTDLAKGSQTLLSFGTAAGDLMPTLKMLGDVSQGNTERFNALTLAFAQVSSAGKMSGQDLLQFINAGFNPLQVISEKTGKSMGTLRDEMEKGAISAQDVADAFKTATSEGGRFYNAMQSQSQTFNGQLSTLKDNAMQFLGDLTAGFTNKLKDTALPMVNGWLTELAGAFKQDGFQGVAAALGSILSDAFLHIAQAAPGIIDMAVSLINSFVDGVKRNASKLLAAAKDIVTALVNGVVKLLPASIQKPIKDMVDGIQKSFESGGLRSAIQTLGGFIKVLGDIISGVAQVVLPIITAALDLFGGSLKVVLPVVLGVVAAITAMNVIQSAIAWWGGLTKAAAEAAAAIALSATATAAETGATAASTAAITAKSLAAGVLTGQVTLATAAQWLWNAAMDANPIGLIIVAVVGLVAAIAGLVIAFKSQKSAAEEQIETNTELCDSTEKVIQTDKDAKAEFEKKIDSEKADADAIASLMKKTVDLSKKENKSADDKETLLGYIDQLNKAVPDLNLSYDKQKDCLNKTDAALQAYIDTQNEEKEKQNYLDRNDEITKTLAADTEKLNEDKKALKDTEAQLAAMVAEGNQGREYDELSASAEDFRSKINGLIVDMASSKAEFDANAQSVGALQTAIENNGAAITADQSLTKQMQDDAAARAQAAEDEKKKRQDIYNGLLSDIQNIFGRIDQDTALTVKEIDDNLKANEHDVATWTLNLGTLASRGLDAGLIEQLRQAGPKAAGTVANLVKASDTELAQLNTDMRNGASIATGGFMSILQLPSVTSSGSDMVDDIAFGVANNNAFKNATKNAVDDAKTAADSEVTEQGFISVGINICKGIAQGVDYGTNTVCAAIRAMVDRALRAAKDEATIKSPSKKFRDQVGKFIPPGITEGVEKAMPATVRSMKDQMSTLIAKARDAVGAEQAKMNAAFSLNAGAQLALAGGTDDSTGTDYDALAAAIWKKAPDMGHDIIMDGRKVAKAVEPEVSQIQADKANAKGRL